MSELTSDQIYLLFQQAVSARENAYAPFSRFPVGAAILASDGSVYSGANVEISSYSLTICAERNALFHAISSGAREFLAAIVVASETECPPCGACRQALADFNPEMTIILADVHGSYRVTSLRTLLPQPFTTSYLDHGYHTD